MPATTRVGPHSAPPHTHDIFSFTGFIEIHFTLHREYSGQRWRSVCNIIAMSEFDGAIGTIEQPRLTPEQKAVNKKKKEEKALVLQRLCGRSSDFSLRWCHCNNCRVMPTDIESYCCRVDSAIIENFCVESGITCITEHKNFATWVIDEDLLQMLRSEKVVCGRLRLGQQPDNRMWRYLSYSTFIKWLRSKTNFGISDPSLRYVIPACVVAKIRMQYPSPDDTYVGYQAKFNQHANYPA